MFAAQNCKWIGGHGEPVKTRADNLYVGHEKVTARTLFSTFEIYSLLLHFRRRMIVCAAFFPIYYIIIIFQ